MLKILISIALLALLVYGLKLQGYGITYQATFSMPRGFYILLPIKDIKRDDIVEFRPPPLAAKFLQQNHLMPKSGLLLKYVSGVPSDYACIKRGVLWINGEKIAVLAAERKENFYHTPFCRKLKVNEYLLISTKSLRSYDSRYFGPVLRKNITARAIMF